MNTYQIRFVRAGGGSYEYIKAEPDNAVEVACEKANEYLRKHRERTAIDSFSARFSPFKPVRTITVVEYSNERHGPVTKGARFKIRLQYIEFRFRDGSRRRDEWYEPVDGFSLAAREGAEEDAGPSHFSEGIK